MLTRLCVVLITVGAVLAGVQDLHLRAEEKAGLSPTEPPSGPSVKTEAGYMVPYTVKIPGTEVKYEMIPIPAGKITIGSPDTEPGRKPEEGPVFEVAVEPFWIGKCEVSWAEYKQYMKMYSLFKQLQSRKLHPLTPDNQVDAITAPTELYDPSFTYEYGDDLRQPAVTMTQYSAKQYTKWLSGITGRQYRLPGSVEWEYACRAGTNTAYFFGDDPAQLAEYAWYFDNSHEGPHRVGEKKPNPWGLHDMHGNVWEWVLDEYAGYEKFAGGPRTAAEAIAWPTKAYPRTVRGGSWDDDPAACRSASKMGSDDKAWKSEDPNLPLSPWWFTSDPSRGVGFRILRPLREIPKAEMAIYWEADVQAIKDDVDARVAEGRGVRGAANPELPAAIQRLKGKK